MKKIALAKVEKYEKKSKDKKKSLQMNEIILFICIFMNFI